MNFLNYQSTPAGASKMYFEKGFNQNSSLTIKSQIRQKKVPDIKKRISQSKSFFCNQNPVFESKSFFESNAHPDSGSDLHIVRAVSGPLFG